MFIWVLLIRSFSVVNVSGNKMRYVVVTIKMPEELLVLLDSYASNYRITRSEAVRRAIKLMIKTELEKDKESIAKVEKIRLF